MVFSILYHSAKEFVLRNTRPSFQEHLLAWLECGSDIRAIAIVQQRGNPGYKLSTFRRRLYVEGYADTDGNKTAKAMCANIEPPKPPEWGIILTAREKVVAQEIANGFSAREICAVTGLSRGEVHRAEKRMRRALAVDNRVQLALALVALGKAINPYEEKVG